MNHSSQKIPLSFMHSQSAFPHLNHHFAGQHMSATNLCPELQSLVEYRLAQMVLEARVRARANMVNLFRHQRQQPLYLQQRTLQASDSCCVAPPAPPTCNLPVLAPQTQRLALPTRGRSLSVTDDGSESTEPVLLCDKSETSSLDESEQEGKSRQRIYVDTIRETDVLCGRGGRSNHHAGNKRYRHVISEMKLMYKNTEAKTIKTDLSRAIVDHVCKYGGRFIKKEETTGRYYVLTRGEARKKTSQALRESKALKWTK